MDIGKQIMKQKKDERPFDKRPIGTFHTFYQTSLQISKIFVVQQISTDKEEAGHVEHIDKPMQIVWASAMSDYHEDNTNPFGYI